MHYVSNSDGLNGSFSREIRALRALSACNEALITARNEMDLLIEVCRIIVEDAGYKLAWFGLVEHGVDRRVIPVTSCGYEDGYLETLHITWSDTERGQGPTGRAARTMTTCIAKDIPTDPLFEPWRTQAVRRGYASSAAFPVIHEGESYGVLNVYAPEPDAFDDDELQLLERLATNIMYGIMTIHTQDKYRDTLQQQERLAREALLYLDILSHDVANKLQAIILASEILQRDSDLRDDEFLGLILNSSDACLGVVTKAKLYRQMMDVPLTRVRLDHITGKCLRRLQATYQGIEVALEQHAVEPIVAGNEFTEVALYNILENSVVHNPEERKQLWVYVGASGEGYEGAISDNGPGIPDASKTHLLDPAHRQSGLGLQQTGELMEKYGGKTEIGNRIEDDWTKGLEVHLWFPKYEDFEAHSSLSG